MRRITFFLAGILLVCSTHAQSLELGLFGGISNYQGDLTNNVFNRHIAKGAAGVTATYGLNERWALRGGFTFTKLTANDKYNSKTYLQARNLNFNTSLSELSAVAQYATFSLDEKRWTPYLFGGLAVYHFNPYTFDGASKLYLQPLSTEGQGIDGYPTARPYARTQLALPFGGGFKVALTENVRLGIELNIRKLFTDHLDDVSGAYAEAADLLREHGPQAVAFAYRADELPGGNPTYPEKGAQRGGARQKDWFYTTGITLGFRLGSGGTRFSGGGKRGKYGCPAVPQ